MRLMALAAAPTEVGQGSEPRRGPVAVAQDDLRRMLGFGACQV